MLVTDQYDGQIVLAAGVRERRIAGLAVICCERNDTSLSLARNTRSQNPEDSSLPLVLYKSPRD